MTLASSAILSCTFVGRQIDDYYPEECKTRAYIQNELPFYLTRRFHKESPVRLAIIPFSAPATIAGSSNEMPGVGDYLVRDVHAEMLRTGEVPIVEIFNRKDWPGKKEEFFAGNYGALQMARDANYDLVMVGYVEQMQSLDSMTVHTRIMEADSGISIWYGQSTVNSSRRSNNELKSDFYIEKWTPNDISTKDITHKLARCVVEGVMESEPVPEVQYNDSILPSIPGF
ncbi:MAG: hypothetical protein R3A13_04685 [Bdellovibrionota bacterium]